MPEPLPMIPDLKLTTKEPSLMLATQKTVIAALLTDDFATSVKQSPTRVVVPPINLELVLSAEKKTPFLPKTQLTQEDCNSF